jgi:PAS domain-containing protein
MPNNYSFKVPLFIALSLVAATPALLILMLSQRESLQDITIVYIALMLLIALITAAIASSFLNNAISNELGAISSIFNHPSEHSERVGQQEKYAETHQLIKQVGAWLVRKERARAALKASEERLNLALSTGGFGTWDWDLISDELNWDSRNHRLYGLKPGSFTGKYHDFIALLHPDDKGLLTQQLSTITENMDASTHEVEYRIILPDGSIRYLADRCEVFRTGANQIERMIGITWERTLQKQVEKPS